MLTDEELTAFLDKECTQELALRITEALETDASLNERLNSLIIDKAELRKAFDSIPVPSASIEVLPAFRKNQSVFDLPFAKIAAGVIVGVVLGAGAVFLTDPTPQADWRDVVASYQTLYTTDTLAFVDQSEIQLSSELARVSAMLEKKIDLEEIRASTTLNYKRAQVLAFQGKPVIQLAFLGPDGKAFALCVTKTVGIPENGLNLSRLEGLETASWSKDGYEYIFIGGQDSALVSAIAKQFVNRI